MSAIHYPIEYRVKALLPDGLLVDVGLKEIAVTLGASEIVAEMVGGKQLSKQEAREKSKLAGYNPAMEDTIFGRFGGYNWTYDVLIPFEKMHAYLSYWEKNRLRWFKKHKSSEEYKEEAFAIFKKALARHASGASATAQRESAGRRIER